LKSRRFFTAPHLSHGVAGDPRSLCDKVAVLGKMTEVRPHILKNAFALQSWALG